MAATERHTSSVVFTAACSRAPVSKPVASSAARAAAGAGSSMMPAACSAAQRRSPAGCSAGLPNGSVTSQSASASRQGCSSAASVA